MAHAYLRWSHSITSNLGGRLLSNCPGENKTREERLDLNQACGEPRPLYSSELLFLRTGVCGTGKPCGPESAPPAAWSPCLKNLCVVGNQLYVKCLSVVAHHTVKVSTCYF